MAGPITTLAAARGPLAGACAAGLLALASPAAHAWSPPEAISVNADAEAFAVAGDPAGNAFAVVAGSAQDEPLMLAERTVATALNPRATFTWGSPRPFPGAPRKWTVSATHVGAVGAAAAGAGAGAIAVRQDRPGGAIVQALVREPGDVFSDPVTVIAASVRAMTRPAVGVSGDGFAVIAAGSTTRRGAHRVTIVARIPGARFRRPVSYATKSLTTPSVSAGDAGHPVVAWVSGTRALASRVSEDGRVLRPQYLGPARRGAAIAAATGIAGHGIVAWEDGEGRIRLARRSGPGLLSLSLPISAASRERARDIAVAVDEFGRAFVTWRTGSAQATRVVVAQAGVGATFRLTTLAQGTGTGAPVITKRPGGGAAVAWAAPAGWQAAKAPRGGIFGPAATLSAPLSAADRPLAGGVALAGPGTRVDVIWRQHGAEPPIQGIDVLQSQDDAN